MVLSRLPIAVAPAQQETVASYLTRLANLHGLPLRELWQPINVQRPGRRDVLADRLAAVTRPPTRTPRPGVARAASRDRLSALRHQPQPGCPRCDARHPGGPVTHLLPHHRYVCTRHRYWVEPPDIDQPATTLGGLDDIVRAQRHHLRLLGRHGPGAPYDAVLTGFLFCGHLWAERRKAASVLTANGPAAPRSSSRRAPRWRRSAPPGCSRRSIPKPSASQVSSPRQPGDTLRPVMHWLSAESSEAVTNNVMPMAAPSY